ncbi:MAG: class I SAM-dependent methyltransferase [Chloroflexota bacterium]
MKSTTEKYGEAYFAQNSNYSRAWLRGRKPLHHWRWRRYLRGHGVSGRVLDFGCGEGYFLQALEGRFEAYGVDVSSYAVARARERAAGAWTGVLEGQSVPFPQGFFGAVTAFDVLEHISDLGSVIADLYRVTSVGGLLVMTTPNMDSWGMDRKGGNWHGFRDDTHCSLLSGGQWMSALESAGYRVVDRFYDGLWDSPYLPRVPRALQHFLFKVPATLLFGAGVRFPRRCGENLILVGRKEMER